jgi:hypothetical protein
MCDFQCWCVTASVDVSLWACWCLFACVDVCLRVLMCSDYQFWCESLGVLMSVCVCWCVTAGVDVILWVCWCLFACVDVWLPVLMWFFGCVDVYLHLCWCEMASVDVWLRCRCKIATAARAISISWCAIVSVCWCVIWILAVCELCARVLCACSLPNQAHPSSSKPDLPEYQIKDSLPHPLLPFPC